MEKQDTKTTNVRITALIIFLEIGSLHYHLFLCNAQGFYLSTDIYSTQYYFDCVK
jgi:hypothetical protein